MKTQLKLDGVKTKGLVLFAALALGVLFLTTRPAPALAHCDSVNGPVVNAAREALTKNDVKLVLPYVQPESEAELTTAFERTMAVRTAGGATAELADTYFFETAVRLHRMGEGAAYTGLKYETDFGPALAAADKALETGSVKDVNKLLQQAVSDGVTAKFQAVQEARDNAARLGTVEAQRERAEAELMFEKYVYELHNLATGQVSHEEGAAAAGHQAEVTVSASQPGVPEQSPYPPWY